MASSRKRMSETEEPGGRSDSNCLGSSFWLLKENISFWSVVKELVQAIISF